VPEIALDQLTELPRGQTDTRSEQPVSLNFGHVCNIDSKIGIQSAP
jgi:hypothetical protein